MEIELDATAAISLVSSIVISNGDLSGLVDDCRELLLCLDHVALIFNICNNFTQGSH